MNIQYQVANKEPIFRASAICDEGYEVGTISAPVPSNGTGILNVISGWKRKGIGRQLICMYAEVLKEKGYKKMHLRTAKNNEEGLKFYRKLGFSVEECDETLYDLVMYL